MQLQRWPRKIRFTYLFMFKGSLRPATKYQLHKWDQP
jgi:hypothetical protein